MKAKFGLIFLPLFASLACAQTTPTLMSYQGRVTDASGTLIGATTPVNRTVTFRVYNAATAGTLVFGETQAVTISGGEFSVLIGNGTGISGVPGPSSPAPTPYKNLGDIINSTAGSLYLGITVDDGTPAADPEIAPRQQLVSGAYALRAKVAETVANGALTTAMIGDNQITTNQILASSINSAKILDGTIIEADLAASSVTLAKLDTTTVGVWTPTGSNVYRSGNVGIGINAPGFPLNFASVLGDKISLYGNSGNTYGFGIQNGLLQIHTDGSGADVAFGYGSSAAMTETMRVKGNGNVGIGTGSPGAKLHIEAGNVLVHTTNGAFQVQSPDNSAMLEMGIATTNGSWSSSALAKDSVIRANGGRLLLQSGTGSTGVTIDAANRVGIGTTSPNALLSLGIPMGGNQLSSFFNVNGGALGTTAGSEINLASFGATTGNATSLGISSYRNTADGGWENTAMLFSFNVDNSRRAGGAYIAIAGNGHVGINNAKPIAPLQVSGDATNTFAWEYYMDPNGSGDKKNETRSDLAHSIISDGRIQASAIDIASDSRIKTSKKVSNSASDLKTLQSIQITDYKYVDEAEKGTLPQKKVIAQQVEDVYPQAVVKGEGVVPDIYRRAVIEDGWVKLDTDLKVGEHVRIFTDKKATIQDVLEVKKGKFRVDLNPEGKDIFVYGREVKDFRSVDYDAISMLNVSATQEIKKEKDAEVKALQDRIDELEKRLGKFEKLMSTTAK